MVSSIKDANMTKRRWHFDLGTYHLGNILHMLSDLTPGDETMALIHARKYWNSFNREGLKDCPSGMGYTQLIHKMPMLHDDYDPSMEPPTPEVNEG